MPVPSQVSTPLFEHTVVVGVHDPTHAPFTQAWSEQATVLLHWPSDPHVWTPFPEHFVAPGTHTPLQAPLTHPYWQGLGAPHDPAAEHVSTPTAEPPSATVSQRVAFGAQTPWHDAVPLPGTQA